MSNNERAARWAAEAIDTVVSQMSQPGDVPNAADVLAAQAALAAAGREGVTAEDIAAYRRTR